MSRRKRLLTLFKRTEPVWKPEDHPDIDDAGEWVRRMRSRTCLDVAKDLPSDLSTNPTHFEGFGKD
ncbi:MAG TPA: hypothetical protein VMJ34_22315 [Bryobacteraceae bacterium]|nr:hypothetical protein [Bryobacteraceae bacterium]